MDRIAAIPAAAEVVITNEITSAFPPVRAGAVPDAWNANGAVPEFTVDVSAAGATAPTAMQLHAAFPEAGTIADFTFTAAATDICTAVAHGLITGDGPVRASNSGGALPAGLAVDTDYWIIAIAGSADTFKLAASRADAFAGTAVNITGAGTGTHTLADTAATQKIKWRDWGVLSSAPTLSLRQGLAVDCDHDPRAVAYGATWTGGTTNATRVAMAPKVDA